METARLFQINVSDGGVPKLAVPDAEVSSSGVAGDRQQDLKHHGGPDKAVCLFSLERIIALQYEGHPIFPGSTGENFTISGLDWDGMVPGVRLAVGDHLLLEITSYATPCTIIAPSFVDGDWMRISRKRHPGWARIYARVLKSGPATVGDQVRVVSAAS